MEEDNITCRIEISLRGSDEERIIILVERKLCMDICQERKSREKMDEEGISRF